MVSRHGRGEEESPASAYLRAVPNCVAGFVYTFLVSKPSGMSEEEAPASAYLRLTVWQDLCTLSGVSQPRTLSAPLPLQHTHTITHIYMYTHMHRHTHKDTVNSIAITAHTHTHKNTYLDVHTHIR